MKLIYRPEIDGLRAIAIAAVILYHAQLTIFGYQIFKGGFIGVDIFFVISGYLISSIILKELLKTGSFSFKYFYERRIRRIIPALLFVMLVSLPFAWIYLLPGSFIDFSKSILYSLGFSSNFYFWSLDQEYGNESGLQKAFLHTWSLSVEEQFYILFPIVLLITFKYSKKYLKHIIILAFIVSLVLADWGSRNYPSFNFYILPTRGWELLAGSILAYCEINKIQKSKKKILNLIFPSIGLLLIVYSILFFNDKMYHPSFYTLTPIIGVCLIIWFSNKNEIVTKILSTNFFIGIGLISYSLYLWHYPIFAFDKIVEFTQGNLFKELFLLIIILILSIFTYYFIEKPFRNKKNKFKVIFTLIFLSTIFLTIINFYIIKKEGFSNRIPEILKNNLINKTLECSDGKNCKFNTVSNKKIYIIGDSHMEALTYDLKSKVIKKNYQFITSTMGGCLYFPGFNLINLKNQKISRCNDSYFQKIRQQLLQDKNSIIIFGGFLPYYLSNNIYNEKDIIEKKKYGMKYISVGKYDTIQNSFKKEILKLSKNNKIILIYPLPEAGENILNKIYLELINKKDASSKNFSNLQDLATSYNSYKIRSKSSFDLLDSIQDENIYRVYPHNLFCNTKIKNKCIINNDKDLFYSDGNHSSNKGSEMINDLIIREIEKIELKFK
jgi:peptidoglycan/LPS O-acetylase OafA/YrhL